MTESTKPHSDEKLDDTLKESFPASDPNSGNVIDKHPSRPADRKPAKIDKATVDKLAEEVQRRLKDQ